jgi:hypothetical protein
VTISGLFGSLRVDSLFGEAHWPPPLEFQSLENVHHLTGPAPSRQLHAPVTVGGTSLLAVVRTCG